MHDVRRYPSLPSAWSAAAFLRSEGILARGYEREVGRIRLGIFGAQSRYECWVAVAFDIDLPMANEMLDVFDRSPLPADDWQDQTEPDLSKLPADLLVPCEWCKYNLRPLINAKSRAGLSIACPECGEGNDPVERVVARHGPEALLECYPPADDPDWIDDEILALIRLPCQRCQYTLAGLPPVGRCPECADPYDKRAIVERSFLGIQR